MEQNVKITSFNTFAFTFSFSSAIEMGQGLAKETGHKSKVKVVPFKTSTSEGTVFFVLGEPHHHD